MSLVDTLESPLVVLFSNLVLFRPLLKVFPVPDLYGFFLGANDFQLELAPPKVLRIQPLELVDGFSADTLQNQTRAVLGGMVGVFPVQDGLVTRLQRRERQSIAGASLVVPEAESDIVHGLLNVLSRDGFGLGKVFENGRNGGGQIGIVPHNGVFLVDFFLFGIFVVFVFVDFFVFSALLQIGNGSQGAFLFDVFELIVAVVFLFAVLGHVKIIVVVVVVFGGRLFVGIASDSHGILIGIPGDHIDAGCCYGSLFRFGGFF